MKSNIHLKLDGIEGESTDQRHKDWIDAAACSDGITMPVNFGAGGGTASRAVFSPVRILKAVDKASTGLREKAAAGRRIQQVLVDFTRPIAGQDSKYLEIELREVFVSEVSMTTQIPDVSQEVVAFEFEEIKITYTQYNASGGKIGQTEFSWNRVTNSK